MNHTQSPESADILSEYTPDVPAEVAAKQAPIPDIFSEQNGVMQILAASYHYQMLREKGCVKLAERDSLELQRIAGSMEEVTGTLTTLANDGIQRAEMEPYVQKQLWCTKSPESVVGKVCANVNKGKVAALHDLHRGMFVVEEISPEAFAQSLATVLGNPNSGSNTAAFVGRFESPYSDPLIREQSRKVIVGFQHEDGEYYTGEIQVHDTEGYNRYVESRKRYEDGRSPERTEAIKRVLGSLILSAEMPDMAFDLSERPISG